MNANRASVASWLLGISFLILAVWCFILGAALWFGPDVTLSASKEKPETQKQGLSSPAPPPSGEAAAITGLEAALQQLNTKHEVAKLMLEGVEKRADNIQKLLAALITVGTLFGLAIGISTYVNLKEIQQSTDKRAAKILEDSAEELSQIRADFPAVARMNESLERILADFRHLIVDQWTERSYAQLDERERQEILLAEMKVGAVSLFEHGAIPRYREMLSDIYRGLGRFYSGRFLNEQLPDGTLNSAYFERAVRYAEEAARRGPSRARTEAQADLGVLYVHRSTREADEKAEVLVQRAKEKLQASLDGDPLNPRALLALAWVEKRLGNLAAAIAAMDKLIDEKKEWKETDKRKYLWRAHFNRACYFTLQGRAARTQLICKQPIEDLKASKKFAEGSDVIEDWLKELNRESNEDLQALQTGCREQWAALLKT